MRTNVKNDQEVIVAQEESLDASLALFISQSRKKAKSRPPAQSEVKARAFSAFEIAMLVGLTPRRLQQMAAAGLIHRPDHGQYVGRNVVKGIALQILAGIESEDGHRRRAALDSLRSLAGDYRNKRGRKPDDNR